MRLLVMNPNTTASMTAAIRVTATAAAAPGTEIIAAQPRWGPESIEGHFEGYLSAAAVLDRLATFDTPFDALVMAGFGEPGREGAQELLDVPVLDITESAAQMAMMLGHAYGIVTTLDRAVPQIRDRLLTAGLLQRCAAVRGTGLGVLELEEDPERTVEVIIETAREVVRAGAEVICLGCGGMAGLQERVAVALGIPVVDGVAAAVKFAEAVVGLGLTTSAGRSFAPPRPKVIGSWPLSTHLRPSPGRAQNTPRPAAFSAQTSGI
ncbi:aspartate/glutamate racemase family protein [Streptomyces sp. DSM 41527]|uniref:Aspartate/glutamate racemase family protein n=1 Tax=Streptomyces mooreae TaxID=3075523 RepID=A0ABU2T461_9ACTN|nr:aspartate/glutamate racemase family protein [Streptomyces sp. DSM 41527]MDT0455902.1 aspartate/glutamate racemase family protein [Streptomyces sp. DSM 41527]